MADFALRAYNRTTTAMHLAAEVSQACNDLYQDKPGDDTTVAVMRIGEKKLVNLMTGPAARKEDDVRMVKEFMENESAIKCVCGGTSANIVARVLGKKVDVSVDYVPGDIPPISYIDGIDLVTEGVVTLNRVLKLLEKYTKDDEIDENFFIELEDPNGASMVAKVLIDRCTDLHLFVGQAVNEAYQNPELPFELGVRKKLVERIGEVMEKLGKTVEITYY